MFYHNIQYKLETSFLNFFYFVNPFEGCEVPCKRAVVKIGIFQRVF